MPLGDVVRAMAPAAPHQVRMAADALHHRDFLTVALVVPEAPASVGIVDVEART